MPKKYFLLPLVLLSALALRAWNYTAIALWHDEAFSALLIRMPFGEMMHRIALDVHPPFYYWLLRFWSEAFGHTLGSLRGFSVFFGVATVFCIYGLIKSMTQSHKLALASSALLAFNPFHIQYSLEARMYTLGTFLVVVSTWVLYQALTTNKFKWWLPYAFLTSAAALTHYFLFFSIAAQGLYVLFWWFKNYWSDFSRLRAIGHTWRWLGAYVLSALLFLPWLPTFLKQFNQVEQSYWIPKMDFWSIPATIWKILLGGFLGAPHITLTISSIIFVVFLVLYLYKYRFNYRALLFYLVAVPFCLATLVSLKQSLFLDRYFIFASVFATVLVALVLANLKNKFVSTIFIVLGLGAGLFSYVFAWQELDVKDKPGMKAASDYVFTKYSSDDKIVVASTFIYFSYRYYHLMYVLPNPNVSSKLTKTAPPPAQLYLQGISSVNQLPHFSGTALLEDDDFVGDLSLVGGQKNKVWLIWTTGFGGTKPQVPTNWSQMDEQKFPDVFAHRGDIFVTLYGTK